jgi:hypothetical protein
MSTGDSLQHYLALLRIRQRAARRDAIIIRWLFLVSPLASFASGFLGYLTSPGFYIVAIVLIAQGAGYLTAWTRLHTAEALIELVAALLPPGS